MNNKPRFTVPEPLEHFLGQWGKYDLYFDSGCCIARSGNAPKEYLAGDWRVYAEQALSKAGGHQSATLECFRRAYRNNLIPTITHTHTL